MAMEMGLEEGVGGLIETLIDDAIAIFRFAEEPELLAWAVDVKENFEDREIQAGIALGLWRWRRRLLRTHEAGAELLDDPAPYRLLMAEFSELYDRAQRKSDADAYGPGDHSLDVGEVALESLKEVLGSHPVGRAFISLVLELVKLARAIGKRVSSGF